MEGQELQAGRVPGRPQAGISRLLEAETNPGMKEKIKSAAKCQPVIIISQLRRFLELIQVQ